MQPPGPKRRRLEGSAPEDTRFQKALTVDVKQTAYSGVDSPLFTTTCAGESSQGTLTLTNTISVSHFQSNAPIQTGDANHPNHHNHQIHGYGPPGSLELQEAMETQASGGVNMNGTVCFGEVSIPMRV